MAAKMADRKLAADNQLLAKTNMHWRFGLGAALTQNEDDLGTSENIPKRNEKEKFQIASKEWRWGKGVSHVNKSGAL